MSLYQSQEQSTPPGSHSWKLKTAPLVEPVTLSELKEFAEIDHDDRDEMLKKMIKAMREEVEEYLHRALIEQSWLYYLDAWFPTALELPRSPLISITAVLLYDNDDASEAWSSDNYLVDITSTPGRIVDLNGPPTTTRDTRGIEIEFKAGYGTAQGDVPEPIRQAIMRGAALMFDEKVTAGKAHESVAGMICKYKVFTL